MSYLLLDQSHIAADPALVEAQDPPDYPLDRCVHQLFEAQAARTPNATALVWGDTLVSYQELNRRANHLARDLRSRGVGPDTLVGLCMDRSPEQVVSVLAVLKAGGAYLPLDPTYPRERLALMLNDARPPILLAQPHLIDRLPAHAAQLICPADPGDLGPPDDENCSGAAAPDTLAYVIYTSGSTGLPKGVLIDHRGLTNHTFAMVDAHTLEPSDRVLQFVALSFDASAAALFPALAVGATLVLPTAPSPQLVGDQLTRLCEQQQISVIHLPASVWHQWVDDLVIRGAPMRAPIKVLLVGGEPPSVEKLRAWARLVGRPMTFLNAYGPTEATITATFYRTVCDEATVAGLASVPMGHPLPGVRILLLDGQLRPVPAGTPGEVYIGGVGLARGYLNRPVLTAERFVEWAAPQQPPLRLYRTGDLARRRLDGSLEFLGRIDHQVKLRGFRIELGEIEAALEQHPAVRHAVLLAREDVPDLQRLVAYVVVDDRKLAPGSRLRAELGAFLRAKLPEYMVPSIFVQLAALPLTSNGKIDRQALPAPEADRATTEAGSAPSSMEEHALAQIWASVLGLPRVGVDADFFALGGHSLLAARAVALVNATLHHNVPLRLLFEAPTVAAFARAIAGVGAGSADLAADAVLDPAIAPPLARQRHDPAGAAFLTGATGFLGACMLGELLAHTSGVVFCLVRARDSQEAARRIQRTLEGFQLWRDEWRGRIVPVAGDLREPLFGLSFQAFQRLASAVDVIYHAGAQVHYLHPYETLRAANVGGTTEVLRLACQHHLKQVHYVSTIAVATIAGQRVYEDDLPTCTSPTGYVQSKWVAEAIAHQARSRGLPITIYRPGRMSGHSQTGVVNADDFFVRLLAGCVRLGLAPDIQRHENLVPVDYAARAIVRLSQQPESAPKTYHLVHPTPIDWPWVVDVARQHGYPLQLVPADTWHQALAQAAAGYDPALHSLLLLMPQDHTADWLDSWTEYCLDTRNADAGLEHLGLRFPPIDATMIARMLDECARRGFCPAQGVGDLAAAP